MFKLGLIINPIAGMGGSVALKGSDGDDIIKEAIARGARPQSSSRALVALSVLQGVKNIEETANREIQLITYSAEMGEKVAKRAGFIPTVLGRINSDHSTSDDTRAAVKALQSYGVDLILFAGGDGTARDICQVVNPGQAVLGIPCGVKMHSGVYAVNPQSAGELVKKLVSGQLIHLNKREVRDLDEDAFRNGVLKAKFYGELLVPEDETYLQAVKSRVHHSEPLALQDIAVEVVENLDEDTLYIVGSGTTTQAIMDELGLEGTLLGVDLVRAGKLIAANVGEKKILAELEKYNGKIIVTVIGGQGHIFGRGNQQISSEVIRKVGKENIIIVATKEKLDSLNKKPLLVDTGDPLLDKVLSGYLSVIIAYQQSVLYRVNGN